MNWQIVAAVAGVATPGALFLVFVIRAITAQQLGQFLDKIDGRFVSNDKFEAAERAHEQLDRRVTAQGRQIHTHANLLMRQQ